uniref:Uncharacterized protein n=2 Tax=Tanacetum cinerariifolium TaxID=118510 RepID=A0A699KAK3_TANCI|nr:hypothetical protein [Tanacetum cinerariifolium]
MLLAQAQEAGVVLDEEQHDFLADSLEETNDCEDLQLQATTNIKADHIDAYDSDCDDEATTNEIFMANMSHVGSLNDDTVSLHYDSDTLSKEQSDIKGAFKAYVIPFSKDLKETFKLFENGFITEVKEMKDEQMEDEVDQCSVAKKDFKIKKKQLLINNDRLLEENIASDIMCTFLCLLNEVNNCGKCKSLDIVLLDLQESNKSLCELKKPFEKLEEYNITLDITFQNHKEQMNLHDPDT